MLLKMHHQQYISNPVSNNSSDIYFLCLSKLHDNVVEQVAYPNQKALGYIRVKRCFLHGINVKREAHVQCTLTGLPPLRSPAPAVPRASAVFIDFTVIVRVFLKKAKKILQQTWISTA